MVGLEVRLTTRRCILRPLELNDAPVVHEAFTHPGFTQHMREDPPKSLEETEKLLQFLLSGWRDGSRYLFAALHEDQFTGAMGLRPLEPGTWNLGFWVRPCLWGKGFAREFGECGIEWGMKMLKAEKIRMAHAVGNARSQRVIEKLGATRTGEGSFQKDNGALVPEIIYEISRKEWLARGGRIGD